MIIYKMSVPFWLNNPKILFDSPSIWPMNGMTFEEKINSITRFVILLTLIGFILTKNIKLIFILILTLGIIITLYKLRKQKIVSSLIKPEGFSNKNNSDNNKIKRTIKNDFHPTTKKNPFGNVLLTDIADNPDRKSAAPSFNPEVENEINRSVKKQTQMLNPDIINTNKQIYGDLYENYQLDQSMMRFYATANSRVENDQGAFSKFLYGGMHSSKEDTPEGAMMRVKNNGQWINP
jgi:hypothetical protein